MRCSSRTFGARYTVFGFSLLGCSELLVGCISAQLFGWPNPAVRLDFGKQPEQWLVAGTPH
jgi:hypothetical protein